jgi:type II secretory pathway pseudopilin PulG
VAIIILTFLGLAITPPLFLAAGTRIQARRADQANQIGQSEIDRVRTIIERGNIVASDLPDTAGAVTNLKTVGAAAASITPSAANPLLTNANCTLAGGIYTRDVKQVAKDKVVLVDQDGDCKPDYLMQVFRNNGNAPDATTVPTSFDIGVRVYVLSSNSTASETLLTDERASVVIGSGAKDKIGVSGRRPMSVLYSTITRSDTSGGLGGLCRRLGGTATTCK